MLTLAMMFRKIGENPAVCFGSSAAIPAWKHHRIDEEAPVVCKLSGVREHFAAEFGGGHEQQHSNTTEFVRVSRWQVHGRTRDT